MRFITRFLLGVVLVLAALELALRVLPSPTATRSGYYVDPQVLTYPPHHEWVTASGWDLKNARAMRSNNFGFATSREFVPDSTAVALIGDSFVEASALQEREGPGTQLEERLANRPVYVMAVPGSNLLDYAERVRFAAQRFGVRDFVVVLERGDLRQSVCGNENVSAACLDPATLRPRVETKSPPGVAKRLARESAAAQYLLGQLRLDPRRLASAVLGSMAPPDEHRPVRNAAAEAPPSTAGAYVGPALESFLERVKPFVSGKLILVLDAHRAAIYRNAATGEPMPEDPDRRLFLDLARTRGIEVIDLEPLFAHHIARSTLKLEVGPNDGHWNRLAVSIVMDAVAKSLLARDQRPVDQPGTAR